MDANYIPLGTRGGVERIFPVPNAPVQNHEIQETAISSRNSYPKVIGATPEERSRIAREIRLAQKKEKKKAKQEAKAARKENGILHRRMNRNNEKYSKNKDRNEKRDIDYERRAIQEGAVRQAELLASIHDPTGKSFNVGEIIVMSDGKIKSKTRLAEQEEVRKRRAQELAMMEAKVKRAEEAFAAARAKQEAECEAQGTKMTSRQFQMLRERYPIPAKISKTQMAKREVNAYRPPPPKPTIPAGLSVPEGEENLLALWDITDQEIKERIAHRKREKTTAAKSLRRLQKEKKKFNRAVKNIKKQCASAGVPFDLEAAKKEVLGMVSEASNSDSDSDDDSDSDSDSESGDEEETKKVKKGSKEDKAATAMKLKGSRPKIDLELLAQAEAVEAARLAKKKEKKDERRRARKAAIEAALEADEKAKLEGGELTVDPEPVNPSTKRKRSIDEEEEESKAPKEKKAKKSKKSSAIELDPEPTPAEDEPKVKKEKKERKSKKVEETPIVKVEIVSSDDEEAKAKRERKEARKAKKAASTPIPAPADDDHGLDLLDSVIATHDKKMKEPIVKASADQWNPEALAGDDARKNKFMKLLGAGKGKENKKTSGKGEKDAQKTVEGIARMQSELERQYESGMKMKHDGGGKRRGLGA